MFNLFLNLLHVTLLDKDIICTVLVRFMILSQFSETQIKISEYRIIGALVLDMMS